MGSPWTSPSFSVAWVRLKSRDRVAEAPQGPCFDALRHAVVRRSAARPVADAGFPLGLEPLEETPDVPVAYPNQAGGLALGQRPFERLLQKVESLRFPSAHREHVLDRHTALPG